VNRQAYLQVPPLDLFGIEGVVLEGRLDHLILAVSDSRPDVAVREVDPGWVAARMAASLEDERSRFLAHYRQFLYAFPHRRCDLVDTAPEREKALLMQLLAGRPAHEVRHPYPMDLAALVDPVLTAIRGLQAGGVADARDRSVDH